MIILFFSSAVAYLISGSSIFRPDIFYEYEKQCDTVVWTQNQFNTCSVQIHLGADSFLQMQPNRRSH